MNYLVLLIATFLLTQTLFAQPKVLKLTSPRGGEKFRAGSSVTISWDTSIAGTFRSRYAFQFATSAVGPWATIPGLGNVLDSGRTRGRVDGGWRVPAVRTTTGFIRMILLNPDGTLNEDVWDRNDQPFEIEQPPPIKADSILRDPIKTRVQLSAKKIYGLDGYVFVDSLGVLVIEPGTIVIGDTVGQNSAICVNRGGKIIADGTPQKPIIFTSSAPPGQRRAGDWGGLLICGLASTNHPGGEAALEGGIADANRVRGWFGGRNNPNDDDSSGVLRYVRIEFAGIAAAPNQELNSLTMGGVGRKTKIENVMVSYANDDSYEWFGGSVNAKRIIAYNGLDDDFDTDNGYSGKVQFALSIRDPQLADVSNSQVFECDNDAAGSWNAPMTNAIFSNVTAIGPLKDTSWTTGTGPNRYNSRYNTAVQFRRNCRQSLFNSVILGWNRGVQIYSTGSQNAAKGDTLQIRRNHFYGIKLVLFQVDGVSPIPTTWLEKPEFQNYVDRSSPYKANLTDPFGEQGLINPVPKQNAGFLNAASFVRDGIVRIDDPFFERVSYLGAFSPVLTERWDLPWAEYDPINAIYEPKKDTVKPPEPEKPTSLRLVFPNGGEKFRAGSSVNIIWDTTIAGTYRSRYAFQFGTSSNGPWTTITGLSNVLDSGRTRGRVDGGWRVPAIKTTTGYIRMVLLNPDGTLNESVSDINDAPFEIEQPLPVKADSILRDPIKTRVQLTSRKIYALDGYVFVDSLGVLVIEPGTVIIGDTVGQNSAIC
ncbi:MAG: hypothetical protein N2517_03945, partial [Ignavibacteria bacterium]|nr:hypothetical protein [Ignavibacteria bacterium]